MNFMVRPSKSFLYDMLESRLENFSGAVGIDAASADFKNRRMFKTKVYCGLDIDLAMLKKGLAKFGDESTFGILANMTELGPIPTGSVDVVVSTNTFYQISAKQRDLALLHLCRITAPAGHLLVEMSLDREFDRLLGIIKQQFSDVRIWYYQNFLSRFYEWIFERGGYLGSHSIAGLRPFRLLSWFLSRLEYLTSSARLGNRHGFVVATRKYAVEANFFALSDFGRIGERIFKLKGVV